MQRLSIKSITGYYKFFEKKCASIMIIDAHFAKIIAKNKRNVNDYLEKMS